MNHHSQSGNRSRQSQAQAPNVNMGGISQLLQGIPELQNLMNLNQLLGGAQGAQSQQTQSAAAQHQAQNTMGQQFSSSAQPQSREQRHQSQQQARPPQQSQHPHQDVNLVLNEHCAGIEVTEQDAVQSLTINGHNNQVSIQEGVTVPCVLANGHNNFIFSQGASSGAASGCENYGQIGHLIVQGHNNRYESLVAKEIEIFGHNNQFSEIYCQNLVDQGQNNKFRNLFQFTETSTSHQPQQQQQQARSSNSQQLSAQQQAIQTNARVRQQMRELAAQQAGRQQQQPQYEFSTDEEADFEEYGIQDVEEDVDIDGDDDDDEEDLVYEDSDDGDLQNHQYDQMSHGGQHYSGHSAQRPQMSTTMTLNINGQPVQINQNPHGQQAQAQAASMGGIPQLNNIQQLTNMLGQIPSNMNGQQFQQQVDPSQYMQNQGFGGTFFTQDANNGGYYSSNGHTINIQGPSGGSIHVAVDDNGQAFYQEYPQGDGEEELLDEFPQDLDDGLSGEEQFYEEDENLDSDGEPLPSAEEIKDIINSIPSYKFEEAQNGYESSMSMAHESSQKKKVGQNSTHDSYTDRKKKEIKRTEKEVSCSICLEVLRNGAQVKALQCRHVFHTSCIHSWLKQKLQCPNCKKKVRLL